MKMKNTDENKVQEFNAKNLNYRTTTEHSYRLSKVKSKNTKPELLLRKKLWSLGIRYRINVKNLPGKPDIVIGKHKIAIFVDGEFWHGYNWSIMKTRFKTNKDYWLPKIERNMIRDSEINAELIKQDYTVVRLWENEIKKNLDSSVEKLINLIMLKSVQNEQ